MKLKVLIKKNFFYILFTFFLIGVFLRFYYGLTTDLWGDEAVSFFISKDTSWSDLVFSRGGYIDYNHPPGYYIILKFFLIFAQADFNLRLISLSLFFPSTYLVWLIGKKLGGKQNALIALSIFSVHPLLINLSFQVRPYSLSIFFVLLSIYLFLISKKSNLFLKFLLGLSLGLAFFVSYASIWLVLAIALVLFWQSLMNKKNFSINHFFSLIVFSIFSFFQIMKIFKVYLTKFVAGSSIAGSVTIFDWQKFVKELGLIIGSNSEVISLFLLFFLPIVFLIKYTKKDNFFIFLLFVFTIFSAAIFSIFFSPIFLARQLLVAAIALVFIISSLSISPKNYVFLFFILLMYTYLSINKYGFLFQQNINKTIKNKVHSGDLILTFDRCYVPNFPFSCLNYYLTINNKKADIQLINLDSSKNKQLIRKILLSDYSRIVFFNDYCPDEKHDQCRDAIENLTYLFCDTKVCEFASNFEY